MMLTKLKAKNQITLPQIIIESLHMRSNEFFQVDIKGNHVRLIPVTIEPRYSQEELDAVDKLVNSQKSKAKTVKPGEEFSKYIKKVTK